MRQRWNRVTHFFADPRIIIQLFLGFSAGVPMTLTGTTLSHWLTRAEVDLSTIGIFAVVALPYSLRFLWAPLMDHMKIPFLTAKLGQRRSWGLIAQISLVISLNMMALFDPSKTIGIFGLLAFFVAFSSATQDIVLDAYRTELLEPELYGAGASMYVFGHRLGLMTGLTGSIFLSVYLKDWSLTYRIMSCLILVGSITLIFFSKEPNHEKLDEQKSKDAAKGPHNPLTWIYDSFRSVVLDFSHRPKWIAIILFIVVYKLSDNLIGQMTQPFYIKMGFSDVDIGMALNLCSIWANIAGGLLTGILISRFDLFKILVLCAVLESLSNLCFMLLYFNQDISMLYLVMTIENMTSGMAVTAFVAFLSSVCSVSYTATHYAMMTSLSSAGRTIFAAASGWIAHKFGWVNFFIITVLAGLPSFILLFYIGPKLLTQKTETSE